MNSTRIHGGRIAELCKKSGLPPHMIIDASANLNPLGPPEWTDSVFLKARQKIIHYPDSGYSELKNAIASSWGIDAEGIIPGNGVDEIIYALGRLLKDRKHVLVEPAYASYRDALLQVDAAISAYPDLHSALKAFSDEAQGVLWLGAPNNPDGIIPEGYPESVLDLVQNRSEGLIILDESFIEFCHRIDPEKSIRLLGGQGKIIILRSMTKFWSVPGLRLGWAYASPEMAGLIRRELPNWPLNTIAECFAIRASEKKERLARRDATLNLIEAERRKITAEFSEIPAINMGEVNANFYLLHIDAGKSPVDALGLAQKAAKEGIGLRTCVEWPGLNKNYLRVAIRTARENERIIDFFKRMMLPEPGSKPPVAKATNARALRAKALRARALMVAGTASNVGKSLITAAICRIFADEGIDVAPYKAQNMSSHPVNIGAGPIASPEACLIASPQAVQALACRVKPDARMNPILLLPASDQSSRLVIMGELQKEFSAQEYYSNHERHRKIARDAYDSLASEHDLIIMEGAGSIAEINLMQRDIVNLSAALHANAKIVLVGDIDTGGVFANFIGHAFCLNQAGYNSLSGFVVNKFRGDPALLGDAFKMTEARTGIPVLGCIPMMGGIAFPAEDSLSRAPGGDEESEDFISLEETIQSIARTVKEHLEIDRIKRDLGLY